MAQATFLRLTSSALPLGWGVLFNRRDAMRIQLPFAVLFAAVLACSMHAAPAQAQNRVFVSATGSDGNPCTFASPCRSFQHAHDTVTAGGEIDVLDPGGYGTLTINKSITIKGHGFSGISAPSATAITINAGASDRIDLNGLLIEGLGLGDDGIHFQSGAALSVENSVIRGFQSHAIEIVAPTTAAVFVSNSQLSDNIGARALHISPPTGSNSVTAILDHVALFGNDYGIDASGFFTTGTVDVTIVDCTMSNNTTQGVNGNKSIIRIKRSTITGNHFSWGDGNGGVLTSYGDNIIENNGDGNPTPPAATNK
jgi:hypothetical protein